MPCACCSSVFAVAAFSSTSAEFCCVTSSICVSDVFTCSRPLACSALAARKGHNDALRRWASGLLERKTVKYKFKLTAVALANKLARIVYALATKGGNYDDRPVAA